MSSGFSSIYQKVCPQCMSGNSQDSIQCACGYSFDTAEASADQKLEDEKLYEAYLTARAAQAKQEFDCARKVAELDPKDPSKKQAAAQARERWESAEAEAGGQTKRVEALAAAVKKAAPPKPAAPKRDAAPQTAPGTPPGVYVHPVPKLIRRANSPASIPAGEKKVSLQNTGSGAPPAPRAPEPRATSKPVPKRASDEVTRSACPSCGNTLVANAKCRCTERSVFGMSEEMAKRYPSLYEAYLQSAKAESGKPAQPKPSAGQRASAPPPAIPKAQPRASKPIPPQPAAPEPTASARPPRVGADSADGSVQRSAGNKPAAPPTKECPHCTAVLPVLAKACRCGMTFPDDGQTTSMPGLALGPGEIASPTKTTSTKECPHCTAVLPLLAKTCKCGVTFPDDGQATVMPGLSLGPGEIIDLLDLNRRH